MNGVVERQSWLFWPSMMTTRSLPWSLIFFSPASPSPTAHRPRSSAPIRAVLPRSLRIASAFRCLVARQDRHGPAAADYREETGQGNEGAAGRQSAARGPYSAVLRRRKEIGEPTHSTSGQALAERVLDTPCAAGLT